MRALDRGRIVGAALLALPSTSCLLTLDDSRIPHGDAGASSSAYREVVLADDPLAYWRLGDEELPTARDEKDAHPGTYFGGVKLGVAGALAGDSDTAVEFDADAGSYVRVPGDAFRFADAAPFTIEAWAKPAGFDLQYRSIVARDGDNPNGVQGYLLWFQETNPIGFETFADGEDKCACLNNQPLPPTDAYIHLVATYEHLALKLYESGNLVASGAVSKPVGDFDQDLTIGAHAGGNGAGFTGAIDEVAVYDHVLSAEQVLAHHEAGAAKP